jgi:cyclopropane fatty-acyl-phospholipid synthase-like methyltransferase
LRFAQGDSTNILVFDQILDAARSSEYDFRRSACSTDPLQYLFDEWRNYYRLKWAIAKVLQPASILEVGVRYGYSAAAFLHAAPHSTYLGLDLDSDQFGGVKGAIDWAQEITQPFQAEFLVGDTQTMTRFPGGIYDLIHIDGQQDGDGSWHDLQLAIRQGRWILADGFFWTEQNFLAISHFLYRHRELIRLYGVIPGYAGELLIQAAPEALQELRGEANAGGSAALREAYTSAYYLQDCGGFTEYKQTQGRLLQDGRLEVVAAVAGANNPRRVLDLGCGRGELAYHFANQAAQVLAADYSSDAIRLCEDTFAGELELRERVQLVCADVCRMPLAGVYDAAVASDLIEHLAPSELEQLYAQVSLHLSQQGRFVIHTFPNLWYYQYHYARRRRLARMVGTYLPPEPRTRYESLMHINEQSPRVLKRSLQRHFRHVFLWFGEPGNPARSLVETMSHWDLAATRDLYAVASHSPIDLHQVKRGFFSRPLAAKGLERIALRALQAPTSLPIGGNFELRVQVTNASPYPLASYQPNPVHLSYHWLRPGNGEAVVFDGERSPIRPPLSHGASRRLPVRGKAPAQAGQYVLRLTLVQECVRWFDADPLNVFTDLPVEVLA